MSIQEKIDEAIKKQDLYFIGDALPPDFYAGFKAWLPLAEGGDPKAMVNVAYCYVHGEGVDRDVANGETWYRKAAERGDTRAMLALYAQLKARQPAEAEPFLQQALAAGDPRAQDVVAQRKRDDARAEAEAKQEAAKRRTWSALFDIKGLLGKGDVAGARQRAEAAVHEGEAWAGALLAVTTLTITGRATVETQHHIVKGSSTTFRTTTGTYQTVPNTYKTKSLHVKGEVSNPSPYACKVDLCNHQRSLFIPAGGKVAFEEKHIGDLKKWKANTTLYFSITQTVVSSDQTYVTVPMSERQFRIAGEGLPLKAKVLVIIGLLALLWLLAHGL